MTLWQPGVTYNGGIPTRNTVFTTLTPKGGSTVTVSIASPAVVSWTAHGRSAGDAFIFQTTGQLPTGVVANQQYFVIATGLTANAFEFSLSSGGTAVNSSGTQSGTQSILVDDTAQIQTAIASCPDTEVISLAAGTFTITGNGININRSNITIRGQGPGPGAAIPSGSNGPASASGTYTALWKGDRNTSPFGLMYINQFQGHFTDNGVSTRLTRDANKSEYSCRVASTSGLSVGQLILLDINTDQYTDVFWGNRNDAPGAAFTGSVSGTSLTVSAFFPNIAGGSITNGQNVFYSNGLVGTIASGSGNNWTLSSAGPTIVNQYMESGNGTRRFFCRQDRSVCQMMKIAAISGNEVTFETPFHISFPVYNAAELTRSTDTEVTLVGIENLYLYGGIGGDGNGNLAIYFASYCWVQNVESHYSQGTGIGFYNCYRCEARECFMHETPDPNPGGGGYLCGMNSATSDSLFEDNIMWCGNKVIVMRSTGGGNVIGYNYMDDPFGSNFPMSPEAGINAAHFTTPMYELLEGNYSHQFKGDAFWGNSIYIMVFRNWLSGLRAAANLPVHFGTASYATSASSAAGTNVLHFVTTGTAGIDVGFLVTDTTTFGVIPAGTVVNAVTTNSVTLSNNLIGAGVGSGDSITFTFTSTLNTYTFYDGGTVHYPFIDSWGRSCCDIQAHSWWNSIIGNVLGYKGQVGLSWSSGSTSYSQATLGYQNLGPTFAATGSDFEIYTIGQEQDPSVTFWIVGQDSTISRQGNWDWFTQSQIWHGIGGPINSAIPQPQNIPNSLYLSSKPSWFRNYTWPWVDPSTGTTYVLPAKQRFETYSSLSPIPPGNQTTAFVPSTDPNWYKRWQYGGTNPSVVMDFANGLYWDGSTTSTNPTSLESGGTITAGSGLVGATGVTAIGNALTAFKGSAYNVQVNTIGGSASSNLGIIGDNTPDMIIGTNTGGAGLTFPPALQNAVGADFSKSAWQSLSNSSGVRRLSSIGVGGGTTSATGLASSDANSYGVPTSINLGSYSTFAFDGFLSSVAVLTSTLPDKVIPPPAFTGTNGWWWNGDATNSRILYGNILTYDWWQPWTVIVAACILFYPNTSLTGVTGMFFTNVPDPTNTAFPGYEFWVDGLGHLTVRLINTVGAHMVGVHGTTLVADGKWHVYAASYDGSGLAAGVKIYIDGVLETTTVEEDDLNQLSIISTTPSFPNNYMIGNQTGEIFGLPGAIGLFRQYSSRKSQAFIQNFQINKTLPPIDNTCVLAPLLNEGGSSTITQDASSNGFIGQLFSTSNWLRG